MPRFTEADIADARGNILISPGLKVRHKKSGYEYTVNRVVQDPNGQVVIFLDMPEEPRFTPREPTPTTLSDNIKGQVLYEAEPNIDIETEYFEPVEPMEDDQLAVTAQEFEQDYEVK